jgi:membrane fusion protein
MQKSPMTLFRPEVLAERKSQWLGPVLLAPKTSHDLSAGVAIAATVALLALLFFGTYPRKVRVTGAIVPHGGLLQVFSHNPGTITDVNVEEGDRVKKGDKLLSISTDQQSTHGATGEQVERQLQMRKQSLLEDRHNLERLAEQQKRSLGDRLVALRLSEAKLGSEIGIQALRIRSAARSVTRQKTLLKEGLASGEHVQTAEESELEQSSKYRELERARLLTERDRLSAQGDLDDLPLKLQRDIANVDRNIAMVEEQIAELAGRRESVITAPEAGVVTALQAKRGGHPDTKVPLLAVVPEGSTLEAHIFCASRAVGLLKVGQKVLLRYEAFPYQKFGHYDGTISSISKSAVNPSELGPQMAGLAKAVANDEAVYRVTVNIASQTVQAYGKTVALQPGMQLDADVVLEKRRLVEWMLEPLFTISGTWKR